MDLATAQAKLAAWRAVEDALTSGQAYQLPEVGVTRVDSREVRHWIALYERKVAQLQAVEDGTNQVTLASFS
jgi:hypothetical protein